MSTNIASLYLITAHNYFLKLPKRNGANHLIVQPDFPVFFFLCKCKGVKVYFKGFSFVNNKMFVDNWDALRIYN